MADGMDMTYEELYSRISNGAYNVDWGAFPPVPNRLSANTIIDENQTVVWNRAQVDKHNEARAAIMQERRCMIVPMSKDILAGMQRSYLVFRIYARSSTISSMQCPGAGGEVIGGVGNQDVQFYTGAACCRVPWMAGSCG